MPLPLIPIAIGVSSTAAVGWWWSSSSKDDKPTFAGELWTTVQPLVLGLLILLFLRWLWKKGSQEQGKKSNSS